MKVYLFKVKLYHNKRIWRTIAIKENQTLADFHDVIFEAFDRYDAHLYSFYLTDGSKRRDRFRNCPEFTDPINIQEKRKMGFGRIPENAEKTAVRDLNLSIKDKFEYLFDFGDNWLHEIVLEKIEGVNPKTT
ncbi:MAG: plasmid pRiA4b ORF-3 family protein, partial [Candidatus Latescibacteria bacterium]|nr:plasmid pRiA4b ORF-3 family protein [Candidatus Latescibacterota bacterium]